MSDDLLSQLKSKQLINIDRYRHLRPPVPGGRAIDQKPAEGDDDWKNWQLVPVTAGRETDPTLLNPCSEAAQGLYRAIKILGNK